MCFASEITYEGKCAEIACKTFNPNQRQKDELIGYTKAVTNLLHLRKFATLICDTRRLFIEKCGERRLKSGGGDF